MPSLSHIIIIAFSPTFLQRGCHAIIYYFRYYLYPYFHYYYTKDIFTLFFSFHAADICFDKDIIRYILCYILSRYCRAATPPRSLKMKMRHEDALLMREAAFFRDAREDIQNIFYYYYMIDIICHKDIWRGRYAASCREKMPYAARCHYAAYFLSYYYFHFLRAGGTLFDIAAAAKILRCFLLFHIFAFLLVLAAFYYYYYIFAVFRHTPSRFHKRRERGDDIMIYAWYASRCAIAVQRAMPPPLLHTPPFSDIIYKARAI